MSLVSLVSLVLLVVLLLSGDIMGVSSDSNVGTVSKLGIISSGMEFFCTSI